MGIGVIALAYNFLVLGDSPAFQEIVSPKLELNPYKNFVSPRYNRGLASLQPYEGNAGVLLL